MRFFFRHRAVLDAFRHHEHLARAQTHVAVAQADGDVAVQHHEEVVGVGVLVPDEFALHLHHHQVVPVELADHARLPVFVEGVELLREVDGLHGESAFEAG